MGLNSCEMFEDKYIPEPNSGCWLWIGALRAGYGNFWYKGKNESAHRVSWLLHNGKIPDEKCVLHKCDMPSCVNPDHLFIGTQRDNVIDAVSKGRQKNLLGGRRAGGEYILTCND